MGLPKLRSVFGAFLVPTWIHFASKNQAKTLQKPTPRGTKMLIDFCIVLLSFLVPFWDPSWGHVGHFFAQNVGALWSTPHLFVGSMLFFNLLVVLTPSWPNLGSILEGGASILEVFGLHFGGFWSRFGSHVPCNFGTFLSCSFLKLPLKSMFKPIEHGSGWAAGVTRSAKNC